MDLHRGMKKYTSGHSYYGIEIIQMDARMISDIQLITYGVRIRPTIIIFTNISPCFDLMSLDRWKAWEVATQYDLIPFEKSRFAEDEAEIEMRVYK